MSVFRDVTIAWRGKEYVVTPSLKLLRTIEMMGISLYSVANSVTGGTPAFASMAAIAGLMLRSAGATATDEEIYAEIQRSLVSGKSDAVVEMMGAILLAFTPAEDDEGKADAQTESQSKGRAKKPGR